MQTPIHQILKAKGAEVLTVAPETRVADAVSLMNRHHVGSMVVALDQQVRGILTERDVLVRVVDAGRDPQATEVGEVMTPSPVCVRSTLHLDQALRLLSRWGFRHLPVVEEGRLVGVLALQDLTNWMVSEQEHQIDDLVHYITDTPATVRESIS